MALQCAVAGGIKTDGNGRQGIAILIVRGVFDLQMNKTEGQDFFRARGRPVDGGHAIAAEDRVFQGVFHKRIVPVARAGFGLH